MTIIILLGITVSSHTKDTLRSDHIVTDPKALNFNDQEENRDTPPVVFSFDFPDGGVPYGLAHNGQYIYAIVTWKHYDEFWIGKFDTSGNLIKKIPVPPECDWPQGLTCDGQHLWVSDSRTNYLLKIDTNGNVIDSILFEPGSHNSGLTWDGNNLWVSNYRTDMIYKVSTSGQILHSFHSHDGYPHDLAWDGKNLWFCTGGDQSKIIKMDTFGNYLAEYDNFGAGKGVAWDGRYLWYSDSKTRMIYQLDVGVSLDVWLNVEAVNAPIIVPPQGSNIQFVVSATNYSHESYVVTAWTDLIMPHGGSYGAMLGPVTFRIGPDQTLENVATDFVPPEFPSGKYQYHCHIAYKTGYHSDWFRFGKQE